MAEDVPEMCVAVTHTGVKNRDILKYLEIVLQNIAETAKARFLIEVHDGEYNYKKAREEEEKYVQGGKLDARALTNYMEAHRRLMPEHWLLIHITNRPLKGKPMTVPAGAKYITYGVGGGTKGRGGGVALFSAHQFEETMKNIKDPDKRAIAGVRILHHELGHIYKLAHCRNPNCSMEAGDTRDLESLKPVGFCPDCERKMKQEIKERHSTKKPNPIKRALNHLKG